MPLRLASPPAGPRVTDRRGAKRIIAGIYSAAADRLYDPLVVKGAFRLLGGHLNSLVLEQGRRAVQIASGGPILDMPVGTAYFTMEMASTHHGIVVGADIAGGMVREATRAARDAGITNLACVQADAHHLPFPDGSFAAVLSSNGLQVIPGLVPATRELVRVLAPGGRMFVSVVMLPVGAALPPGGQARLPTMLRGRSAIVDALTAAGLTVTSVQKSRLAVLIEGTRPGPRPPADRAGP